MPPELGATVATLVGFALVDSLNPSCLTILSVLLTRPDGPRAGLAFTTGVLLTYLLLGTLILSGGTFLLNDRFWADVEAGPGYAVQAVVGAILLALNLRRPGADPEVSDARVRATSWPALMSMGAAANVADMPTALPYFAALQVILTAGAHEFWEFGLLAGYNAVYVLPMVVMLAIRTLFGQALITRLQSRWPDFEHRLDALSRGLLTLLGGALLLDAAWYVAKGGGFLP